MLDPSDGMCSMEEPLLAAQPDGVAHINEEEDDLFRMKELIRELPDDVLHFLADSGVVQLGEMEVAEELVAAAFGPEPLLVVGAEHVGCDWRGMWSAVLEDRGRTQASRQPGGGRCLVQAHAVCLRDAASPGYRGLLQPLLKRYQAHGCPLDVFGLPAVHAVISFKWHTWAHRALVSEMLVYVAWLAAFVAFTLLFEGEEEELPLQALLDSHHGRCTLMCSLVALLAMLPFLYMEVCTMVVYQRGWVNLWNVVDLACYGLQVVISSVHLHRRYVSRPWFVVLLSLHHVLLWTKLHYFARVFSPSKNLLVDTIRIVLDDLKLFLVFLGLTMLGFAFAFFSLFREDRDTEYSDFTNFWHAVVSMLSYLLAMFDYNIFYNSTNPVSAMLLFIVFEFVMNVMLLNIMIAVMTSSLSKATREEGHRFLLSRAALIDELEATLPRCLRRPAWSPPFIHLLKVKAACEAAAEGPEGLMPGPTVQQLEQALAAEAQAACARLESTHSQLLQCSAQLDQAAGALARIAWSRCAAG